MTNEDVVDLYNRVAVGTKVVVEQALSSASTQSESAPRRRLARLRRARLRHRPIAAPEKHDSLPR